MRRRSRPPLPTSGQYEAPATNTHGGVDVDDASTEALDHALRTLARLLARQAARELFERERARDLIPEDLPRKLPSTRGTLPTINETRRSRTSSASVGNSPSVNSGTSRTSTPIMQSPARRCSVLGFRR